MTTSGFDEITDQMAAVEGVDVKSALEELAYRVLKVAKEKTPVDTGFLQSSGEVSEEPDGFVVRFTAEYALPVHERTEVNHPNGQAKFLEDAAEVVLTDEAVADAILERMF